MHCTKCDRELVDCVCPDFEERIAKLEKSPYLDPLMFQRIRLERAERKKDN